MSFFTKNNSEINCRSLKKTRGKTILQVLKKSLQLCKIALVYGVYDASWSLFYTSAVYIIIMLYSRGSTG